jgi:hypothetical protein
MNITIQSERKTMKKLIQVLMTTILVLALATAAMAAGNPFVGTWKLNLAKSKYNPGPAPKSSTVKVTAQDNGLKYAMANVDAEGKATNEGFAYKFDGKEYPYTGSSGTDTIAAHRIDASTIDYVMKGGSGVGSGRAVISRDGKTMTVTQEGKDARGQNWNNTLVLDKQ